MIAHIQGSLHYKSPEYLVIDVGGIGYEIIVPLTTFYELPEVGTRVALHVHTHVREQALQLYGFQTRQEKKLFVSLMKVAGIGPRLAANILSGISPGELVATVREGNVDRLASIPGLGRRTAERLVVELRDKLTPVEMDQIGGEPVEPEATEVIMEDALSALVNLGYRKSVAERALKQARSRLPENLTLENLLKESLRSLA